MEVGTGEPGHTFILVGADATIAWIRDCGTSEKGGVMYVEPVKFAKPVKASLGGD
ncbi:MAG: hypothetical protein ACE5JF_02590 [Anaerolineales bacterium]